MTMERGGGSRSSGSRIFRRGGGLSGLVLLSSACLAPADDLRPPLRYVGSSTVANYVRDAESPFGEDTFEFDTAPESAGGEIAILDGRADLAGIAAPPRPALLEAGVEATLLGRDTIAVVVHSSNPVRELSLAQLRAVFLGTATNWSAVGGPDVAIRPYVVSARSATRKVFRSAVLGEDDYGDCITVDPDVDVLRRVSEDPGGIGQISASFLSAARGVSVLRIDGSLPGCESHSYPIARPMYLLWWPARERVARFVRWAGSAAGREVLLRRFSLTEEAR